MKSYEVRKKFLDHFENEGHELIKSSSLIPENDPTLMFNNAGMNQFKGVFLGEEPAPKSLRATTAQKCVRAGGKHNDLDNVGFTARHHTFFEMLGNFSFGDYFKTESIEFAWELLTKNFQLDPKRLFVTVYKDDDEAFNIWKKHIGLSSDKIYRFGEKDNFWRMGDTGPCGPSSEIFYDQGTQVGGDPAQNVMGGEGDRFIEIWNLVFMQFFEDQQGKLNPLPKPSIDTGLGLERLTAIMQGQINNYNSDLFLPLIEEASKITKTNYSLDMPTNNKEAAALRVIADHARAVSFLLSDGVIPSNEGRGYVLRRILRRAIRYGRTLSDQSVFPEVCAKTIILMNNFYPELIQSKDFILQTVNDEQNRFLETLDKGTELLKDEINRAKNKGNKTLDGQFAFKLYDTFGFPSDLTQLMAQEEGMSVDLKAFDLFLDEAKEKSKSGSSSKSFSVANSELLKLTHEIKNTEFVGYEHLEINNAQILKIYRQEKSGLKEVPQINEGQSGFIVFDKTPFYAEGGGQTADHGWGYFDEKTPETFDFKVLDVQKFNQVFVHTIEVVSNHFKINQNVILKVDNERRKLTASNHSATHLLHYSLRQIIGNHVKQAGSLVTPEKLRFDFTNKGPLTEKQTLEIEKKVNSLISKSETVNSKTKTYDQAIQSGALALFGEKYESDVRVISMGPSVELCGGTHVKNLSEIKYFKIISESGVSSGIRRIEALTDHNAIVFLDRTEQEFKEVCKDLGLAFNSKAKDILNQFQKLKAESLDLKKQLKEASQSALSIPDILKTKKEIKNGVHYIVYKSKLEDSEMLREFVDQIKDHLQSGIIILAGNESDKTPLLVGVTKDLNPTFHAGNILKDLALKLGGRGGGRPDFAQGAVGQLTLLEKATSELFGAL